MVVGVTCVSRHTKLRTIYSFVATTIVLVHLETPKRVRAGDSIEWGWE